MEEAKTKAVKAGETQAHLEAELPEAYRDPKALSHRLNELTRHMKPTKKTFRKAATTW